MRTAFPRTCGAAFRCFFMMPFVRTPGVPTKTVHSWERKRVEGVLCLCGTEGTLVPDPLHTRREVGLDLTRATGDVGQWSVNE